METQKIIITGGATRIGAAIAESLASHKNQITIHYNKSKEKAEKLKKILEKKGSKVFLIKADLNKISELNNWNTIRKIILTLPLLKKILMIF